ncbi:MAG: PAS domain S-box protein [Chloroflexi bacterium]|nr:MAG: PAS domain S-box protein [Chloroflexota bacterium]
MKLPQFVKNPSNSITGQLTNRVMLLSSIAFLAVLATIGTTIFITLQQVQIRMDAKSFEAARIFESFFLDIQSSLLTTSSVISAVDDPDLIMLQTLAQNPAIVEVLLTDLDGRVVAQRQILGRSTKPEVETELWLENLSGTGQISIGTVMFEETRPFIDIATLTTDEIGLSTGILIARVDLTELWNLTLDIQIGETGYAYIVDDADQVVMFRNQKLVETGPNLTELISKTPSEIEDTGLSYYVGLKGQTVLAKARSLHIVPWYTVIEQPLIEVFKPLLIPVSLFLLALIGVGFILFATTNFTRHRIVAPLTSLNDTVSQIMSGALEQQVSVKSNDEFGQLGSSFNSMTTQLRDLIRNLEQELFDRKQAEIALRESEERYRQLFDIEPDALLFGDTETLQLLDANRASVTQYGFSRDELLQMKVNDLSAEPEASVRAFRKGKTHTSVRYHRRKDGTIFPVEIKATTFDWQGRRVQFAAIRDITERKQAEDLLRKSQQRLSMIVEQVGAIIWTTNKDLRFTSSQGAGLASLNLQLDQIVGSTLFEYFQTDDKEYLPIIAHHRALKGESATYEQSWDNYTFQTCLEPMRNESGDIIGVIGISIDITDHRQVEDALRQSQERYRIVSELTSDYAYAFHVDSFGKLTRLWVTGALERITEFTADELHARGGWESMIYPEDISIPMGQYQALLKGKSNVVEYRIVTKSGNIRWMRDYGRPEWDEEQGRTVAIYGAIQDITERRLAEEALRESEENLRITINSIGDAVVSTDVDGNVTRMNFVAEVLTGWKRNEAVGKPLTAVFHIINAHTSELVENPVGKVLKTGHVVGLANDTVLVAKDGAEYQIADSGAPIRDADGNITGVVLVFRDVTEQLRTEQELLKVKKLESVGMLAGGIAHDFNNLLTGLFGNLELAKLFLSPEHKSHNYLASAWKSLESATNLTKQLLTFAKGGDPIKETLSIGEVITETAQFSIRGSRAKLQTDIVSDLWLVNADKGQLSQVISNLVINAEQSMPAGGAITISAQNIEIPDGKFVQIMIQDEGDGIAPQHMDKIFDPYFSTKQKGSGLGLAITHSIIAKHNGRITVDSILDRGTIFAVQLPAVQGGQQTCTAQSLLENSESVITSARILVMDDEEVVRQVIEAMLSEMGMEGHFVVEGSEAVAAYRDCFEGGTPYDLVITDLTIPGGMGGPEAAQKILEINPEAKMIASSGYATDPVLAYYQNYGYKGIVMKPFRFEDLQNVIMRVLDM